MFNRGLFFTGASFKSCKSDDYTMRSKDICQVLFDAVKVLESALACRLEENADEDTELVYVTAVLVAEDAKALFELFYEKLRWVVREEEIGELFDRSEWKKRTSRPCWPCSSASRTLTPSSRRSCRTWRKSCRCTGPARSRNGQEEWQDRSTRQWGRTTEESCLALSFSLSLPGGFTVEEEVDTGAAAGGNPEASVDVHVDVEEGD